MSNCHKCHENITSLPFICKRCGETFCSNCRLPEKHNCPNFEKGNIFDIKEDIIIKKNTKHRSLCSFSDCQKEKFAKCGDCKVFFCIDHIGVKDHFCRNEMVRQKREGKVDSIRPSLNFSQENEDQFKSSFFDKIKCFLGFHRWEKTSGTKKCVYCGKWKF